MKILTPRNNKDFYDYLIGIYGIDEKVVYDRRQFTVLSRMELPLFTHSRLDSDAPKKEVPVWKRKDKRVPEYEGEKFNCLLEVGLRWYFFEVERYLDKNSKVYLDWTLTKQTDISKQQRVGTSPMTFFKSYYSFSRLYQRYGRRCRTLNPDDWYEVVKVTNDSAMSNPILTATPIASLIPAEEIYRYLYAYLSSLNDVEVIDSRTDIEKAESAGFDRKTSFRNIK